MQSIIGIVELHAWSLEAATAVVERVTSSDFGRATPCAEWTIGDLLAHMVGQHLGFAQAIRALDAPAAAYRPVEVDAGSLMHRWQKSVTELGRACTAADHDEAIRLVEINADRCFALPTVVGIQLLDTVVHTWDLATSLGLPFRPDLDVEAAVSRVAHQVPDGSARNITGAFGQPTGHEAEDRWKQTLSYLGRSPG